MNQLRYQTILLVIFFISFLTINDLCEIENQSLCLKPSTYITTGVVVVSILAISAFSRYPLFISVIFGLLTYSSSLLLFSDDPFMAGIYLRIAEVAMLLLSIVLAHGMAHHLHNFENVFDKMAIKNIGHQAIPLEQAADNIRLEFIRGHQHERPLSVIVVEADSQEASKVLLGQALEDIQQRIANRLRLVSLARLIDQQAQRTDLILEDEANNRLLILCPETDETKSSLLAQHISREAVNQLGVSVSCANATFPVDALTFDELVDHAASYLSHNERVNKMEVEYSP